MANQIVVSAGAKVRDLEGVLVGTVGVVSSLAINASNGIPQLDVNGKILVSQLPNSVMEYKGTWSAATNTPTLTNGTGNQGDVYLCNVAGTVNFGAGPIAFVVGDQVIYSGTIWQRASGATGTVTSVAASITGSAVGVTGSPITNSGTLAFAFAGTNLQYVNGAGNLTTFPILTGYVPYTGAAANLDLGVYDLTADIITGGTIVKSGGTSSQFLKADGSVDSSVYALDSAVVHNTGNETIGGQKTFNGFATFNNALDIASGYSLGWGGNNYIEGSSTFNRLRFATQGIYRVEVGSTGTVTVYAATSGYSLDVLATARVVGVLTLGSTLSNGTYAYTLPSATGTLALTSDIPSLAGYVTLATTQTISGAKTFSGGVTFSSSVTTNNLTFANSGFFLTLQPPTLSVNRTVTLPNGTGTLALTSDISYPVTSVFGRTGAVVATSGDYNTSLVTENVANLYYTEARVNANTNVAANTAARHNALTIGTANGLSLSTQVLSLALATTSVTGALSSADWTTFNNKQNTITNPVTYSGTPATNYVAKFTSGTVVGNSSIFDNGTTVFINASTAPALGSPKFFVKMGTANTYEGILVASSTNNNVIAIAHTGTQGIITTNYGSSGANTPLAFGANGSAQMTLDTSGNLGLGVTPSAWQTEVKAIQIGDAGSNICANNAAYSGGNNVWLNNNSFQNSSVQDIYTRTATAGQYHIQGNTHIWRIAPSGTAGNAITFTQAMTLNASGNLSVGNTNDTYKLDVSGTGRFSSSNNTTPLTINAGSNATYEFKGNSTSGYTATFNINNTALYIGHNSASRDLVLQTASVDRLTISGSGAATFSSSVGVGGSPSGTYGTLSVFGGISMKNDYNAKLEIGRYSSGTQNCYIKLGNNSNKLHFTNSTDTADLFTIMDTGNVGIGTTSPSYLLDVSGTGNFTGALTGTSASFSNTVTAVGYSKFWNGSNSGLLIGNFSANAGYGAIYSQSVTPSTTNFALATNGASTSINATNDISIVINNGSNGMTIASTGAATFSSSVTANGFFESSSIVGKNIIATNPLLSLDIDVIKYIRKNDESKDIRYGYSAEQINSLMPELTNKEVTAVKYLDVHTILIAQLQKEIKELKAKLN